MKQIDAIELANHIKKLLVLAVPSLASDLKFECVISKSTNPYATFDLIVNSHKFRVAISDSPDSKS